MPNSPRKSRVCGSFPRTLYRCFTKEEHALQFAKEGKVRIGLLDVYKTIECDARRDQTEGVGLYKLKEPVTSGRFSTDPSFEPEWIISDGIQQHNVEHLNPIFLLCCANISADLGLLKSRFGSYVVRIDSPVALAIEIDQALNGLDGKAGPFLVEGRNVEYNKGGLIEDGRTPEGLCDLSYVQKPDQFKDEMEFRLCIIAMGLKSRAAIKDLSYLELDLRSGRNTFSALL